MTSMILSVSSLLLALGSAAATLELKGRLTDLPVTGQDWISLDENVEFLAASEEYNEQGLLAEPDKARQLRRARRRFLAQEDGSTSGYETEFVDGSSSYYNDYAQAWRLLGFYTDCNAPQLNTNECYDDEGGGGGGGGGGEDDVPACQRYLLWAAYVDLDYAGGGIGEYQFYNREKGTWDKTSCIASDGRCAKMDCHLKNTNFQLLGFFKEPNYHEWMEQLFKHQGVCLWTDDEYYFMESEARQTWPCYCTETEYTDENGNTLYYDTKPMPEGRIGLGLYTDSRCKYDYTGDQVDVSTVLSESSVSSLQRNLQKWNDAFDVFKVCQPCKAYSLGYVSDVKKGDRQGGSADGDGYDLFSCYDDAGYTNVNQCMKFKTKTEMIAAEFRDVMLAHQQGNIVEFQLLGNTYGYGGYSHSGDSHLQQAEFRLEDNAEHASHLTGWSIFGLVFGSLFLCGASGCYIWERRATFKEEEARKSLKEPLMADHEEKSTMERTLSARSSKMERDTTAVSL